MNKTSPMKRSAYILSLLLILLCVGCSTPQHTLELINRSESVAEEYPDSALLLIQQVDSRRVRGKQDKARYRLIYSEALYHNQIDSDCDSLTRPLFDYYYYSDCHEERARAMYQHGLVMRNSNNLSEAIFCLSKANESLQEYSNPRLQGLVYRVMGDIYSSECLFNDALAQYLKSKEFFDIASLPSHKAYVQLLIAQMYSKMRLFSDAIDNILIAEKLAIELGDEELLNMALTELALVYVQIDNFENCQKVFERIDLENSHVCSICYYHCINAIICAYNGDYKSAKDAICLAEQDSVVDQMFVYYAQYKVAKFRHDYKEQLMWYTLMIDMQDTNVYNMISDSVLRYEVELYKNNMLHNEELYRKSQTINRLSIALMIILISGISYYIYSVKKREQQTIATLKEQVDSVKDELREKNKKIMRLSVDAEEKRCAILKMQYQINDNICRNLHQIDELLEAYYSDSTKSHKHNELISAIDNYVATFAEADNGYSAVEKYVNQSRSSIMSLLRAELPFMKETEYRLVCLYYADFSTNAICMFLGYDKNKLYKQKSKIKSIIGNSTCTNRELFLKYL